MAVADTTAAADLTRLCSLLSHSRSNSSGAECLLSSDGSADFFLPLLLLESIRCRPRDLWNQARVEEREREGEEEREEEREGEGEGEAEGGSDEMVEA